MTPFIRIALRYFAAYLVTSGMLDRDSGAALAGDPDVIAAAEVVSGAIIAVGTEVYYALAKAFGWRT